ncbi:MAG: BLUF domain-containing protein [Halieaceae bacterium]|jgi:hypothetical protein|nr:BLUF domain-containing protein [Halieaceae bacterium]
MTRKEHDTNEELFQIAYISESVLSDEPDEAAQSLQSIAERSHRWNSEHQITGALLFSGAHFGQIIEGPSSEVIDLYAAICADPRHASINQLSAQPILHRDFAEWSTALLEVGSEHVIGLREIHASVDKLYATKHGISLVNLMQEWLTRKEQSMPYFRKVV